MLINELFQAVSRFSSKSFLTYSAGASGLLKTYLLLRFVLAYGKYFLVRCGLLSKVDDYLYPIDCFFKMLTCISLLSILF